MAGPWVEYLSRTAYLLQQGRFVADVAWFYGEEGSLAALYAAGEPDNLPVGYGYDFVSRRMLLCHLSARDGSLVSSGGAQYRLLYLGGSSHRMTLAVLRKLKALSDQGIQIAGRRPGGSPSLADEGQEDEYQAIVEALWGHGIILDRVSPNTALEVLGLTRDFSYEKPTPDSNIMFLHRRLIDGDLYYLTNRKAQAEAFDASFRVVGRKPELWHADSGVREPVTWRLEGGRTVVRLSLHAHESVFVVFREATERDAEAVPAPKDHPILSIEGCWKLSFEPGRGAPQESLSTPLGSWSDSAQPSIKYFSGIATYLKSFAVESADLLAHGRLILDLGQVHELAEITLNGQFIGTVWHAPFELDVTPALQAGTNVLEIRVANLWVNCLIGDKQPGAVPVAFTVTTTYKPDAPLRPSGIIGPVTLTRRGS
jgi:hypothetical protein